MTNTQLKALHDSNLATNASGAITAAKLREVTSEFVKQSGGYVYYANSGNAQSLSSGVEVQLTNDGQAASTYTTYAPEHITGALFSSNAIQIGSLSVGDFVQGRFIAEIEPDNGSNNMEIHIVAKFKDSEGQIVETQQFADQFFKDANQTHYVISTGMFFVTEALSDGTVEFYAEADESCDVKWESLLLKVN